MKKSRNINWKKHDKFNIQIFIFKFPKTVSVNKESMLKVINLE